MKKYTFEQTVLYGNNYNKTLTFPDNVKFCEWTRYNDKQRFLFSVVKDPSDEMRSLFSSNFSRTLKLGNLLIGILSNVMPISNIPEMTIDEVNELYSSELRKMYIVSECINQQYSCLHRDLMCMCIKDNVEELKDCLESPEAKELIAKLEKMNPKYIEAIVRPIKFIKHGSDNGPTILCDFVQFRSWLDSEKIVNSFTKEGLDSGKLAESSYSTYSTNTTYMGDDAKPWKEMFENRIKEITESAFE